ncbi:class I SAM-dependent methyltransferase [Microvirga flavescens]|uniref:class I SAM-dependent methyltransferase n=1 Tax=Microvirga flavescens TaxID=2249811 RepID=UPI000DD57934|nr:class I SAM-dependent methyltransferase [Microvirga flavescens]
MAANWAEGYVVDIGYTHGFYRELSPSFLSFAAAAQGIQVPGRAIEPLTYCELGCGQGFSTNLLAAAHPHIQFHATDFNPAHIAGAWELAKEAQLKNIAFYDDSFEEFLKRDDLPDFDFITLHGIYSWISPENRKTIVRFIRDKLKPGGLVYISYNAMPGWSATMPLRRLLVEHAETVGSGSRSARIKASLEFASRLQALNAQYFEKNPQVSKTLEKIKTHDPNYVAHEYFNRDLHPFYFCDVAEELAEAKLQWVGFAGLTEAIEELHLSQEQLQLLSEIDDVALRQTIRDHIINQQFRRDIFVKGPIKLAPTAVRAMWLDTRFALSVTVSDLPKKVAGVRSALAMREDVLEAIGSALANGPRTLREMLEEPTLAKANFTSLIRTLTALIGQGSCVPCLPPQDLAERQAQTDRLNMAIARHARHEKKLRYFASGETGSAFGIDRLQQLFWLGLRTGEKDVPLFVAEILRQAGQRLLQEGKPVENDEENLALARTRFETVKSLNLQTWKNLGIAVEEPTTSKAQKAKR